MTNYNIYFGTVGKTLGCKYRFTKKFENAIEAKKFAENSARSLYYKYEGKYGIPTYSKIIKESEITGIDIEKLYLDHFKDMCRWYAIPTKLDTISNNKLKF